MTVRGRDVIVIGASAGGVEALRSLAGGLPPDLPAAVFMVMHLSPTAPSTLPDLIARAGPLPAAHPPEDEAGTRFERRCIYVAPPGRHMVIEGDRVQAVRSATGDHYRPGVDVLFRSAARHQRRHVIGVILTGALDDGAEGLAAVKHRGGLAVVQDPADAQFASMPQSAMHRAAVDHCVPLAEIPGLLARLVARDLEPERAARARGETPSWRR